MWRNIGTNKSPVAFRLVSHSVADPQRAQVRWGGGGAEELLGQGWVSDVTSGRGLTRACVRALGLGS